MSLKSIKDIKKDKFIIGFSGPSTSGKSTVIKAIMDAMKIKDKQIIRMERFFYGYSKIPEVEINDETVPNLDLKESINWEKFFEEISKSNYPLLIIDGFILFADDRSNELVDVLVTFEYNIETDFQIGLDRRIHRMKRFFKSKIPDDYNENPFDNDLNYCCAYFHQVVWPEMVKHPEYRKPQNWEKPTLTLSATDDLKKNIDNALEFVKPFIDSHN